MIIVSIQKSKKKSQLEILKKKQNPLNSGWQKWDLNGHRRSKTLNSPRKLTVNGTEQTKRIGKYLTVTFPENVASNNRTKVIKAAVWQWYRKHSIPAQRPCKLYAIADLPLEINNGSRNLPVLNHQLGRTGPGLPGRSGTARAQ